jgi:hypothetical protein
MRVLGTRTVEYLPSFGLLLVTLLYLATAYGYEEMAREMPVAVAWVMIVLLVLDITSRTETKLGHRILHLLNPAAEKKREDHPALMLQLSAIFWPLLFTGLMIVAGVLVSVLLYVFGFMRFHGKRSMITALGTAVAVTGFTWFLFAFALSVELYPGLLFQEY